MIKLIPGSRTISFVHHWINRYPNGAPGVIRYCLLAFLLLSREIDRRLIIGPPRRFKKLVQGKRVCIVGPSKGVLRNPPGLVESYDLVVRLNSTWPVLPERQDRVGKRCDIWYHVCNHLGELGDIANHRDFPNTRFVRLMPHIKDEPIDRCFAHLGRARPFLPSLNYVNKYLRLHRACKLHAVPMADFHHTRYMPYLKRHKEKLTNLSNTGFFAICELLDCDIAELYITGITFNCENDLEGYPSFYKSIRIRENADTLHYSDGIFEVFKRIRIRDKRVRVDTTLDEIIRLEKHRRVEHYAPETSKDEFPVV
ncbi:MAG: hypothetical protein O7C75_15675 [Verrucomicrobia bacterium]|nr:hypothetical protein [Verrucomicrobiota bacterium]